VAWSMFEGRNQEHLTADELRQLHDFVDELEWKISEHLYRSDTIIPEEDTDKKEVGDNREDNHETPITSEFTQETNDLDLRDGISSPSRDQGDRPRNRKCTETITACVIIKSTISCKPHSHSLFSSCRVSFSDKCG
jgi:hypothetical protein